MDPYRTLFDSLFETFLILKVSNNTSHLKSHLKVSNKQQMRPEMRCAISALHKANWLPCWNFYFFLKIVNKCDNTDTENIKLKVLTILLN